MPPDNVPQNFPEWIDEIGIDPDGLVYGFEGNCYFDGNRWVPIDDFDGLRFKIIGKVPGPLKPELCRTLHFSRVSQETGNPYDFPARPRP